MLVPQTVTYALVEPSAQLVKEDTTLIKSTLFAIAHVLQEHTWIHHIAVLVPQIVTYVRVELLAQHVHPAITSLKSILSAIAHVLQEHT